MSIPQERDKPEWDTRSGELGSWGAKTPARHPSAWWPGSRGFQPSEGPPDERTPSFPLPRARAGSATPRRWTLGPPRFVRVAAWESERCARAGVGGGRRAPALERPAAACPAPPLAPSRPPPGWSVITGGTDLAAQALGLRAGQVMVVVGGACADGFSPAAHVDPQPAPATSGSLCPPSGLCFLVTIIWARTAGSAESRRVWLRHQSVRGRAPARKRRDRLSVLGQATLGPPARVGPQQ